MSPNSNPAPFDSAAADYDRSFTDTVVGRVLRRTVWRHLDNVLDGGSRVLELGCGTGEDALWLAERGHRVVATDASSGMLEQARCKIETAGVADRVRFAKLDLEAIGDHPDPPETPFDAVFSNFGALNCIEDHHRLAGVLHRWLRPGGRAVFVVMGPFCLWETGWYSLRLRPRTATRRWRDGRRASVGEGRTVRVWYPSATALGEQLTPYFRLREKRAIGALVPPIDAAAAVRGRPGLLRRLEAFDHRWAHRLSGIADHYLLSLERCEQDAAG